MNDRVTIQVDPTIKASFTAHCEGLPAGVPRPSAGAWCAFLATLGAQKHLGEITRRNKKAKQHEPEEDTAPLSFGEADADIPGTGTVDDDGTGETPGG